MKAPKTPFSRSEFPRALERMSPKRIASSGTDILYSLMPDTMPTNSVSNKLKKFKQIRASSYQHYLFNIPFRLGQVRLSTLRNISLNSSF
jgi:hypothetical protein